MEKDISILVIDDDTAYAKGLAEYARSCGRFLDAAYACDGLSGLELLATLDTDVIVLDSIMPRLDGIGFLRRLRDSGYEKKPVIIMNMESSFNGLIHAAAEYGVDYFMIKPQKFSEVCETAYDLCTASVRQKTETAADPTDKSVGMFLKSLGIPAHLSGYRYIRAAILMTAQDAQLLMPITKKLYPTIAERYGTTKSCVERAIRHAISVSWSRGNKKLITDIFGYSSDNKSIPHPTNAEYIAMASDDFRLRIKHNMI